MRSRFRLTSQVSKGWGHTPSTDRQKALRRPPIGRISLPGAGLPRSKRSALTGRLTRCHAMPRISKPIIVDHLE